MCEVSPPPQEQLSEVRSPAQQQLCQVHPELGSDVSQIASRHEDAAAQQLCEVPRPAHQQLGGFLNRNGQASISDVDIDEDEDEEPEDYPKQFMPKKRSRSGGRMKVLVT